MQVFNASTKTVVLRPFAAGKFNSLLECVFIKPGQEVEVAGPILSEYGLKSPYKIDGKVLIRDWAQPWVSWVEQKVSAVVAPRVGKVSTHKQPFMKPGQFEGFQIAFFDDRDLII